MVRQASIAPIRAFSEAIDTACTHSAREDSTCSSTLFFVLLLFIELIQPRMSLPGAAGSVPGGMPRLTGAGALDPNDPNIKMVSLEREQRISPGSVSGDESC